MKRMIIALCAMSLFLNASVKAEETKVAPAQLSAAVQEVQTGSFEDGENEKPKKKKSVKKTKKSKKVKKVH